LKKDVRNGFSFHQKISILGCILKGKIRAGRVFLEKGWRGLFLGREKE